MTPDTKPLAVLTDTPEQVKLRVEYRALEERRSKVNILTVEGHLELAKIRERQKQIMQEMHNDKALPQGGANKGNDEH
jgi:hypothetical protein